MALRALGAAGMALLLVFPAAARTGDGPAAGVFESRYYTIHHNLPDAVVRHHGAEMDLMFAEYSRRFAGLRDRRRGRMKLYLLRSREDYLTQLAGFGMDGSASGGMFFYGDRGSGLATWVGGRSDAQVAEVLRHEGLHQFARNFLGNRIPIWVNEGLATYFEQSLIIRGKVKLGIAEQWRIDLIKSQLDAGRAIDFDELLRTSSLEWRDNMASGSPEGALQYTQSWSIVYFLIHGEKGRYRRAFSEYLAQLSNGRTHEKAFQTAFGTDQTAGFARKWERFIREELNPDHYSTAVTRMVFLGLGLATIHGAGEAVPASPDELRGVLEERGFSLSRVTHAGAVKVEATDPSLYGYQDSRGATHPFVFKPAAAADAPPSVAAPRLQPTPVLKWRDDGDAGVRPEVVYE